MSAQTTYKYATPVGVAGGIVDLAPYAIDSFINEENNGVMQFGIGVMTGTTKGVDVKKSTADISAATFEGITNNNRTTELTLSGETMILKKAAIGVMRYGRIWAKVATGATPEYGDPLYMVKSGDEAGYFTDSSSSTLAVKGRFLGGVDGTNMIAEVELFNQAQS